MERINTMVPKYLKGLGFALVAGIVAVCAVAAVSSTMTPSISSGRTLLSSDADKCVGDIALKNDPDWPTAVKAIIYLIFLGYLFLGVAISADTFMSAIEVITSKTKTMVIDGQEVEVEIWNDTIANLTLMALGSSAPEIMIAVIETIGLTFEAGDLGAGTIVGSAAFNLLFITAICVSSLPEVEESDEEDSAFMKLPENLQAMVKNGTAVTELRTIEEFGVYAITAVASLFAYFWMIIVLQFVSSDVVDMWEALLTLIFFPILVLICWLQDSGWCGMVGGDEAKVAPGEDKEEATEGQIDGTIMSITSADGHTVSHKPRRHSISDALSGRHKHHETAASDLSVSEVKKDPQAAAKKSCRRKNEEEEEVPPGISHPGHA